MGLKENIYQAFTKSGGEFELKKDYGKLRKGDKVMIEADRGNTPNHTRVKTSEGGVLLMPDTNIKRNPTIDKLADDLSKAIRDFIIAQPFRVEKLSGTAVGTKTAPGTATGAAGPSVVNPLIIPEITIDIDKDGYSSNPKDFVQSNKSEVRLREGEVVELA